MLALKVFGVWVWLVVGASLPAMLVGLLAGQGISSEHLADHYATHLPQLAALLLCLAVLVPVGDYLTRRDLEARGRD